MVNKIIRPVLQLTGAFALLIIFCMGGVVFNWTPASEKSRRKMRVLFTHHLARALLKVIRVDYAAHSPAHSGIGKLIVANHTSVLDAIVLAARSPCVFVTSVEIEENFVLEFLAKTGGALFIERRFRERIQFDQEQIRKMLLQGFDVALFPEGTSTNGTEVLKFKAGLFPAAQAIRAPVEAICITVESIDHKPVSDETRDRLYYYGDHLIQDHLYKLFTNPPVSIQLNTVLVKRTSPEQDPRDLANECRNAISKKFSEKLLSTASLTAHFQYSEVLS